MNERVPDSSGLPLRAMVMVLLFLGVVFLLLGFQAAGSSSDDESSSATTSTSTSATTSAAAAEPTETSEEEAAPQAVHVFNISEVVGAADTTAEQLRGAGVEVGEVGNMPPDTATETTVFYPDEPGAEDQANEVSGILGGVPVALRTDAMAEQPPGILVVVTG